jgi:hypothetical protein
MKYTFEQLLERETCQARTRAGTPCKRRDIYYNGRCPLHGGLSTGPITPEGLAKVTRNLPHMRNRNQTPCDDHKCLQEKGHKNIMAARAGPCQTNGGGAKAHEDTIKYYTRPDQGLTPCDVPKCTSGG